MVRLFVITILNILLFSVITEAAPISFSYQGQIVKPNGQTLEASNVTFTLEILSPGVEACVLYEETHTINMSNSNGVFSLEVGTGSRSGTDYEDTNPLTTALSNSTGLVSPTNCDSVGTYTPVLTDSRKMRVTFDDGTGPNTLTQDHNLVSVPFANSASSIDGLNSADLLTINTGGANELSQANLESVFTTTNRAELMALLGGTSTQYMAAGAASTNIDVNSNRLINVGNPTAGTDATNRNYVDANIGGRGVDGATISGIGVGQAGQVLTWNGTQWTSSAPSGDSTKLPLDGSSNMSGNLNLGTNNITNATNITLLNDLTVGNDISVTGGIGVGTGINSAGTITAEDQNIIRLGDSDSSTLGGYVGLMAPATVASDLTFTLPNNYGSAGQVLSSDGSGALSWVNDGSPVTSVFTRTGAITAQTSDYDAVQIDNTAAGNIVATNVQAAINELDGDKVAKAGDTMTGDLVLSNESDVRFGDSVGGEYAAIQAPNDLIGNYTLTLPADDGDAGEVLSTDGSGNLSWVPDSDSTDHGGMAGLGDDDHSQYAHLSGRLGGQTLLGGTAPSNNLVLESTSDVTKGNVLIQPNGGNVGIGTTSPTAALDIVGEVNINSGSLGIGTTVPAAPLHVYYNIGNYPALIESSDTNVGLLMKDDSTSGSGMILSRIGDNVRLYTGDDVERVRIEPSGNVGIGTTAPAGKLDVDGDIRMLGSTSGYAGFQAPATAPDVIWTLPNSTGAAGQVMQTDGSGALSWVTPANGTGDLLNGGNAGAVTVGSNDSTLALESNGTAAMSFDTSQNATLVGTLAVGGSSITSTDNGGLFTLAANADSFTIDMDNNSDQGSPEFNITSDNGTIQMLNLNTASMNFDTNFFQIKNTKAGGTLELHSANSLTMKLDASNNVGIGTTAPLSKLDVEGRIISGDKGSSAGDGGSIIFEELSTSTDDVVDGVPEHVGFRAPDSVGADIVWELPGADGSAGQVLQTNGSGVLSWVSTGGSGDFESDGSVAMTGAFRAADGSQLSPSITFANDTNTGLFSSSADEISMTFNGSAIYHFNADNIRASSGEFRLTTSSTASFPTYTFNGDADTGMFRPAANELAFSNNGTETIRVGATGNVGIGTTAPAGKLDVDGDIRMLGSTSGYAGFQAPPTAPDIIWTLPTADGAAGEVLQTNGSGVLSWTSAGGAGDFESDGSVTMTGTFKAANGTAALPSVTFGSDTNTGIYREGVDLLGFSTNGLKTLSIDASSNYAFHSTAGALTFNLDASAREFEILNGGVLRSRLNGVGELSLRDSSATERAKLDATGELTLTDSGGVKRVNLTTSGGNITLKDSSNVTTIQMDASANTFVMDDNSGQERITLDGGSGYILLDNSSNAEVVRIASESGDTFFNYGNVGIGTNSPEARLDVEGRIISGDKGSAAGDGGSIIFEELSTSTDDVVDGVPEHVGFRAPDSVSADIVWELPGADGSAGQVLQTDGSGVLSWVAQTSGADDLGDHIATANIQLNGNWLSNDGGNEGIGIDNSGNVGIGTTAPTELLHVSNGSILVQDTMPGTIDGLIIRNPSGAALDQGVQLVLDGTGGGNMSEIKAGWENNGSNDSYLSISTRETGVTSEKMRIDSSGKVGIGTANPEEILHLANDSSREDLVIETAHNTGENAPDVILRRARGSFAGKTTVANTDKLGGIRFQGHDGTSDQVSSAIYSYVDGAVSAGNVPSTLEFHTTEVGTMTEKMRIEGNGYVGIGTTAPGAELDVTGTGAIIVPDGTSAQRPGTPQNGMIRYNSDNNKLEAYENSTWVDVRDGTGGAGDILNNGNAGAVTVGSNDSTLALESNGTAALNFDTSQNATFQGDIFLNDFIYGGNTNNYLRMGTGGSNGIIMQTSNADIDLITVNNNDIKFTTNSAERMRITNSAGYIGIGTTAPIERLDVEGRIISGDKGSTAGDGGSIVFEELSTSTDDVVDGIPEHVGFRAPDSVSADIVWQLPGADGSAGQVLQTNGSGILTWTSQTSGADDLGDHTATANIQLNGNWLSNDGGNEGISIDNSGNVGIGTAPSSSRLSVNGILGATHSSSVTSAAYFTNEMDDDNNYSTLSLRRARSSATQPAAGFGTGLDFILEGTTDGNYEWVSRIIAAWETTPTSAANRNSYVSVSTMEADTTSEKLRIASNGYVGIGTTAPGAELDVTGTGAIIVPDGTSAQRPGTPQNGMIRYNSDNNKLEAYENSTWVDVRDGTGGAGDILNNGNTGAITVGSNDSTLALESNGTAALSFDTSQNATFAEDVDISSTTSSTNSTTGALTVGGGLGVAENIYAGSGVYATYLRASNTNATIYGSDSGTASAPSGVKLKSENTQSTDGVAAFINLETRNASGNFQRGFVGAVSNTGAGVYAPDIVIGRQTSATTWAESMRIDSSGNVGIGTTAPTANLQVKKDINSDTSIDIENSSTGSSAQASLNFSVAGGDAGYMFLSTPSNANPAYAARLALQSQTAGISYIANNVAGDHRFYTDGYVERMRLNNSGNVGIGTTAPGGKLDVDGDIRMLGSTSGYAGFQAPATAPDVIWTLPTVIGAAGNVLQTDGSGALSWVAPSTTSPAGADREIQFNDSGSFGSASSFAYNSAGDLELYGGGGTSGAKTDIDFFRYRNTQASPQVVADGDLAGSFRFNVYDGASYLTNATIEAEVNDATIGIGDVATHLVFKTGDNGSPTERVRIPARGESIFVGEDLSNVDSYYNSDNQAIVVVGNNPDYYATSVGSANTADYTLSRFGGTLSAPTATSNGDNLGSFRWEAHDGTSLRRTASISAEVNGIVAFNSIPTDLIFSTDSSTDQGLERMRISSSGNIGIGTSVPAGKLDVDGDIRMLGSTSGYAGFQAPAAAPDVIWTLPTVIGAAGNVLQTDGSGALSWVAPAAADNLGNHTATANVQLNNNWLSNDGGSEGVRVTNSGAVGIGTATPGATLDVYGAVQITQPGGSYLTFFRDDSTVFANDELGVIQFGDTDNNASHKLISAYASEAHTASAGGNYLTFGTVANTTNTVSERVRIDSTGNVGIGTTAPAGKLDVDGDIRMLGSTSGYAGFQAPATAPDIIWTLPTGDGSAGHLLQTNGSGALSWVAPAAADNLGNHIATANIQLNDNWLSNDGGNEGIRITNDGNVGIGTTAPSDTLAVSTSAQGDIISVQSTSSSGWSTIDFLNNSNAEVGWVGWGNGTAATQANQMYIEVDGTNEIAFWGNSLQRMVVDGSGNVGIGTTVPGDLLHVYKASGSLDATFESTTDNGAVDVEMVADSRKAGMRWYGNAHVTYPDVMHIGPMSGTTNGGQLGLMTGDGVERVRIDAAGEVGIGTTLPTAPLHISSNGDNNQLILADTEGGLNDDIAIKNNGVRFEIDNIDTPTNLLAIHITSANLAIGTDVTSGQKIHLHEDSGGASDARFTNSTTGTTSNDGFAVGIDGSQNAVLRNEENTHLLISTNNVEQMRVTSGGNVGIGTTTADDKLVVDGTIRNAAAVDQTTNTTIDFTSGNIQYTTDNCGAFNLHNMRSGGSYTFVVQGATSATCSFSAYSDAGTTALTVHMPSDHGATTASKHTIYTAIVAGTHVYFSWIPDL